MHTEGGQCCLDSWFNSSVYTLNIGIVSTAHLHFYKSRHTCYEYLHNASVNHYKAYKAPDWDLITLPKGHAPIHGYDMDDDV